MAKASGTDLAGFKSQLSTTALFYTPKAALDFVTSPTCRRHDARRASSPSTMVCSDRVRASADAVGMAFANGVVIGNKNNVKLRFDPTYVAMAADGQALTRISRLNEAAPCDSSIDIRAGSAA